MIYTLAFTSSLFETIVAILAIMELGDLRTEKKAAREKNLVAILAIMELGDLLIQPIT